MLLWRSYRSDIGRVYPFYAVSVRFINDISTTIVPLDLLPPTDLNETLEFSNPCGVPGLTPRQLRLVDSNGAEFLLNYWQPFNQTLFDYLTNHLDVAAFEFIGERVKYGRLRKMLENV